MCVFWLERWGMLCILGPSAALHLKHNAGKSKYLIGMGFSLQRLLQQDMCVAQ